MTKRILSLFWVLVISICMLPAMQLNADATPGAYNVDAAIKYAQANWNSGKGLCAEFVSECLRAGGADVFEPRVVNLYNALVSKGYGKSHQLTLTNGKKGTIRMADNVGKVEKGDPIFYYCNVCKSFSHVVLCNGENSNGYLQDFAHNKAHDGTKQCWTWPHCGSENWTVYSIRMLSGDPLLGTPTTVDATKINYTVNVEGGIYFKWDKVNNATYYRVYRRLPGGSWLFLKNVVNNYYLDTTAENGKEYIYTVRACKGSVFSAYYDGNPVKFLSQVKFKSITNDNTSLVVSWNKNDAADGYYLYRQVGNGNWLRIADITNKNTTSYVDKDVKSGTNYRYRIRAFSGATVSSYDVNGIGTRFLTAPVIKGTSNIVDGISFSWQAVSGSTGYRIYRRASGEKYWTYLETVAGTTYIDNNVKSGVYYRYTARSVYENNYAGFDSNGSVLRCVSTPKISEANCVENGIEVKWNEIAGAMGYYVYHKAEGAKYWTRIATLNDATSYIDTAVEENKTYAYTVKAFYGYTMSGYHEDSLKCQFIKPEVESQPEIENADLFEINLLSLVDETITDVETTTETTELN